MATKKSNTKTKSNTNTKKKKPNTKGKTQKVDIEAEVIDVAKREAMKEIALWVMLAVCVLLFLSNLGIGGVVGNAISGFFFGIFGLVFYLFPILLLIGMFFYVSNSGNRIMLVKLIAGSVFILQVCILVELISHGADCGGGVQAFYNGMETKTGGGFIGGFIALLLIQGFGLISAYVITLILAIICIILVTERSLLRSIDRGGRSRKRKIGHNSREERLQRIQADKERQKQSAVEEGPRRNRKISGVAFDTSVTGMEVESIQNSDEINEVHISPDEEMDVKKVNRVPLSSKRKGSRTKLKQEVAPVEVEPVISPVVEPKPTRKISVAEPKVEAPKTTTPNKPADKPASKPEKSSGKYIFPTLSLLTKKAKSANPNSKAELESTADKLEQTLKNFGINVEVTDVTCGPTVTRYELLPEVGVRVNRITNLADDIKLNLAVTDIRIEAPIPGKAAVGIEVPNSDKVMVTFEELIASKEFQSSESKVTFGAGRDIAGNVITANIAKMPHLLIAGTTGSGKSVCINTIIMSILYKATPEEVKFIMIDPKVVELSIYNDIPHLLQPVVTDPKKAAGALHWAVMEMDDRYQRFANAGVRDIKSYNQKLVANNYQMPINSNGEMGTFEKMPEMVVIVDELADLMMVAAKEVEESICRLAQKARAAGIYLILATQRPSVDVVTGLIKANMPSRIAFAVKSGVDSRTILDMFGAEKLLGNGDMLYYPSGYTKPLRVQGAFVSDTEVSNVVDFIKKNNEKAKYDEAITKAIESGIDTNANGNVTAIGGGSGFDDARDAYFAEAGRLVVTKEKASIGMLQRYLKVGFNRAARIIDQLEEAGVVGQDLGTKPRDVLMNEAQFENYLNPGSVSSVEEEYPVSDDF